MEESGNAINIALMVARKPTRIALVLIDADNKAVNLLSSFGKVIPIKWVDSPAAKPNIQGYKRSNERLIVMVLPCQPSSR